MGFKEEERILLGSQMRSKMKVMMCTTNDGTKYWVLGTYCHREDGPAIEWHNGNIQWWLDGIMYTFQDYIKELKRRNKSNKDLMLLMLKYG
jgi:hypothetical protein